MLLNFYVIHGQSSCRMTRIIGGHAIDLPWPAWWTTGHRDVLNGASMHGLGENITSQYKVTTQGGGEARTSLP